MIVFHHVMCVIICTIYTSQLPYYTVRLPYYTVRIHLPYYTVHLLYYTVHLPHYTVHLLYYTVHLRTVLHSMRTVLNISHLCAPLENAYKFIPVITGQSNITAEEQNLSIPCRLEGLGLIKLMVISDE